MKKLIALLFTLGALCGVAQADTTTSRWSLVKPDVGSTNWGPKITSNYDIIDNAAGLALVNTFTSSNTFNANTWFNAKLYGPNGSQSVPTYAFAGSQNIGIYTDGSSLLFAVGGVKVMSTNASTTFINAGDFNVNGSANPNLYVTSQSGSGVQVRLLASGTSAGYVQTNTPHPLYFTTNNGPNALGIDVSQNVFVGALASSSVKFQVATSSSASAPANSGTNPATGTIVRLKSNSNAVLDIGSNGSTYAWIQSADQTGLNTSYDLALNPNGGDVYSTGWTDYSGSSTIVGWASFTTQKIFYKKIGKTVFVYWMLEGTSNSTTTTFTLPVARSTDAGFGLYMPVVAVDNGSNVANPVVGLGSGASTMSFQKDIGGTAFTNTGTKKVYGQMTYQSA